MKSRSQAGLVAVALAFMSASAGTFVGGCAKGWGGRCAADDDCFFSRDEWTLVQSLGNISRTPPKGDPSNELLDAGQWAAVQAATRPSDLPPVVRLGWRLYHDPRLSGDGSDPKDTVGRSTPAPRLPGPSAPQLGISCATCHDPALWGSDFTSQPPNVSNGAGWYDVNTQQTLNVARFAPVFYWNGRADSLWSQAAQVMESPVSMNGNRAKTLWLVSHCYQNDDDYKAVFGALTSLGSNVALAGDVLKVASPATATTAAFKSALTDALQAHPELPATLAARVHVNVAKAIAAYEWFLTSDHSRFDEFVARGPASGLLTPSEKRGLKLFIGHAGCVNCHNTSLLSDGRFHDIGVSQRGEHVPTVPACTTTACDCRAPVAAPPDGGAAASDAGASADAGAPPVAGANADGGAPPVAGAGVGGACLPAGAYSGLQKLHGAANVTAPPATTVFRRCTCFDNEYYLAHQSACDQGDGGAPRGCDDEGQATYADPGPSKPPLTWLGAWRTPSLRDVAMTAPYMHDGAYATLADVVWHYDQGVASEGLGTSELSPLNLSDQDRADLVAFLGALTGTPGPPALIAKPDPASYPLVCVGGSGAGGDGGAGSDGGVGGDGSVGGDGAADGAHDVGVEATVDAGTDVAPEAGADLDAASDGDGP